VRLGTSEAVIALGAATVTVTLCEAVPPLPVQLRPYAVVDEGLTACEPEVAFAPDHPPEAVHEPALVDDQLSVDDPPELMLAGDAERDTLGTGDVTVTRTLVDATPPMPLQVRI
jgi:hypothetical protein